MSVVSYTRENIERFAKALARYDREEHADLWISNATVVAALRGHALCFANDIAFTSCSPTTRSLLG